MRLIHSNLKGRRTLAVPRLLPVPGYIQEFYPNRGHSVERDTETNIKVRKIDINYEYGIGRHGGLMIVISVINSTPYG